MARSDLILLAILVALALALGLTGLAVHLGAHPFWADTVVWIGAALGLVAALLSERMRPSLGLGGFALVTALAVWAAVAGKARFVASYAEDAFAGRLWYFGWIGFFAGLFGLVFLALRHRR